MDENIPLDQKSEIAFTVSAPGISAQTRASSTTHGFTTATDIVARYVSYKASSVGTVPGDAAEARTSRTVLKAKTETSGDGVDYPYSDVEYFNNDYKRYWDDAYSRLAYLSIYAIAVPGKVITSGQTNYVTNNSKSLLELVHEGETAVSNSNVKWKKDDNSADANNNVAWKVSSSQDATTLGNEDLCYSNNIQKEGKNGRYVWNFTDSKYAPEKSGNTNHADGQMRIALQNATDKTSTGHFDRGHLVFNHALTRLTVNLRKGTGFKTTDPVDPFKFKDGTNVKILGVSTQGTLNLKTGIWTASTSAGNLNIDKMSQSATAATGYDYTLQSQFIPGFVLHKDVNTSVLEYTIDDNVYYITEASLYDALKNKTYDDNSTLVSNNAIELKQGKNYVINIVVNKTEIASVTASLVDWDYVTSEMITPENHYITISNMMDNTSTHCTNFDLYRANDDLNAPYTSGDVPVQKNWFKHYTDKATLSATSTTNVWKTAWFWESNKSFYHFRTVNKGTTIKSGTDTNPKDNFVVTSGQLVDDNTKTDFNDYHWGAPMLKDATMKYDETKGFEDFLYPAIGSTTSTIHLIEHHMMSNVHIVLHTPTKTGDVTVLAENGVKLKDGTSTTTVALNRFCAAGTVEMARGVINPTADVTASAEISAPTSYFVVANSKTNVGETNKYSYRVVPQALNRGTTPTAADKIGLTITTPDGNQYFVPELAIIKAQLTADTQHHKNNEAVTRWYPGYDYTYHITLKKTGIESITCTIVDWIRVNTENIEIGL